MPQYKKKKTGGKPADNTPDSAIDKNQKVSRVGLTIAALVIAAMAVTIGLFYYQEYVAPFQRIIITVDDTSITMDQFLKRTRLAGASPMSMLEVLTREQVIKLEAPKYGITISPEDMDQELMAIALGESETISDSEFKEWYRQQLNETRLSDSEYREIVTNSLLAARLQEYLGERTPTVAAQIHLHAIILDTYENAEKVRTRWEEGEDFADLAREVSLDEGSREKGGDLGWVPRGIFRFDYIVFNLDLGEVSDPIPSEPFPEEDESYFLFMVSEKADVRELDEASLQMLKANVLETWFPQVMQLHEITYNFNSEIDAWLNWQLSKQ